MFAPVVFGHLLRDGCGIWTAAAIAAGPPEAGFLSNVVPIALTLYCIVLP